MSDARSMPLFRGIFYFLRHGETESNERATVAGSMDVLLTEYGREQARSAALTLANHGITTIYSSRLRRAHDTAEIVASKLNLPVDVIPELAERNWGVLEGMPRQLRVPGVTPEGAETPEEFSRRVVIGLAKITSAGIPLIVAHSGVHRVLCQILGIAAPAEQIENASPMRWIPPERTNFQWRAEIVGDADRPD
jgi:probable phosphoglycerate mutase